MTAQISEYWTRAPAGSLAAEAYQRGFDAGEEAARYCEAPEDEEDDAEAWTAAAVARFDHGHVEPTQLN